jgi:hypothetical protein
LAECGGDDNVGRLVADVRRSQHGGDYDVADLPARGRGRRTVAPVLGRVGRAGHQAVVGGPPLFFICDEVQYFLTSHYTRFFVDCRRYNISINISLHTKTQLDDRIVKFLEDTVHTRIALRDKFEADVEIGDTKIHKVRLYPPIKIDNVLVPPSPEIPPTVSVNFLRDAFIPV